MFNDKLFNFNEFEMLLNSLLIFNLMLSKLLSLTNRLLSSANNINSIIFEVLTMSFIQIKNSKGPKTDPCGTPHVIGANLDFFIYRNIMFTII